MKNKYKIENEKLKEEIYILNDKIKYLEHNFDKLIYSVNEKIKFIEDKYENKVTITTNTEKLIESIENRIIKWCDATWTQMSINEIELLKVYVKLIKEVNK